MQAYYQQPHSVTALPAWQELKRHREQMQRFCMCTAFAEDDDRFQRYSVQQGGLFLDYSKNLINEHTLGLLIRLAEQAGLHDTIQALFSGQPVNASETRAALHTMLRAPAGDTRYDSERLQEVHQTLERMNHLVEQIHSEQWRGCTGKPIREIVNIGIGGSFLGPQLVSEALTPFIQQGVHCSYLANIDGSEFHELTARLDPETTLFIISSKSFTTLETLKNSQAARDWYLASGGTAETLHRHFIAVTGNHAAAVQFGIHPDNIFPIRDWVGGRYSLWSAIGLPIALSVGSANFRALLSGAHAMDQHFRQTPFRRNMPVLMALLSIWYNNFWEAGSHAILPYDHYLRDFTHHLQQLDMESSGKSVRQDGSPINCNTGPVIWGGVGCNGQHAYHQLLHQGTRLIPADFIVPINTHNPLDDHHQWLFANCLSQAQALMRGKTRKEAEAELRAKGLEETEVQRLAPHKVIPGNRPSNTLLLERVTPANLGALIALYEHKVFVQSAIWGTNAFDQWGVELGKKMGNEVYQRLTGAVTTPVSDGSTQGLIEHFHRLFRS